MNVDETRDLCEKGRKAWNEWAKQMLARRKTMEEAGDWTGNRAPSERNEATRKWMEESRADFGGRKFKSGEANFTDFVFPGKAIFEAADFQGGMSFMAARFYGSANFRCAKFRQGVARFNSAKFSGGEALFDDAVFSGGEAAFRGAVFSGGEVSFRAAEFSGGPAVFAFADFSGGDVFFGDPRRKNSDAKFSGGQANFDGAEFSGGVAVFAGAEFSAGYSQFIGTKFSGGPALFDDAKFKQSVKFDSAQFSGGGALFRGVEFSGESVSFDYAVFSGGKASFQAAKFSGKRVTFAHAKFLRDVASFSQCVFDGDTSFQYTRFEGSANFSAIRSESAFSLAGATFREVPDFIQARFSEAPRLDELSVEQPRLWSKTLVCTKIYFKGLLKARWRALRRLWPQTRKQVRAYFAGDDLSVSARWRALKRLAIQGHDHNREHAFFKAELLSRRWSVDKIWHGAFLVGLLYQLLSDFGRSMGRPLLWWTAGILVFAWLYLGQHPSFANNNTANLSCVAGPSDPWRAALGLSLNRSLIVGVGSNAKLNEFYACLYGVDSKTPVSSGNLPNQFRPIIPDILVFLGMFQQVYSAVLIFLFVLAVRNHFRIK